MSSPDFARFAIEAAAFGVQSRRLAAVASRTNGLSVISRIATTFGAGNGTVTTAGTIAQTARIRHTNLTGKPVSAVQLVYANYAPASSTEGAVNFQLQVKAAIEPYGTVSDQSRTPLYANFYGQWLATMDRFAVAYSQEIALSWAAGTSIYERTGITSTSSSATFPRSQIARGGASSAWAQNTGEGVSTSDQVFTGSITNNASSSYNASLLLGRLVDGSIAKSANLVGDSICVGADDQAFGSNSGGWPNRAFANIPGGNFAIAGEKLSDVVSGDTFRTRFELTKWSTTIVSQYGRNDVGAGQSAATIKTNVLAFAYRFMTRGQHFVQSTILPSPTSTDGWYTVENQSKESGDSVRVAVNQWLRDSSSAGFVAQAAAQVAGIPSAGSARFLDSCVGIECNSAGVLTSDGGYILGAQSAILASGTATATTTLSITDSTKAWPVNGFAGIAVYVTGGTGAGQVRTVQSNTATVLAVGLAFSPALDTTSTYRVADVLGFVTAVHPTSRGHAVVAAGINAADYVS